MEGSDDVDCGERAAVSPPEEKPLLFDSGLSSWFLPLLFHCIETVHVGIERPKTRESYLEP